MGGNLLLDTNIVIALFAEEKRIIEQLSEADEVFLSSIVIGELNYGARKSSRFRENLERINLFAAKNIILPCDIVFASYYGEIKDQLRQKVKPVPENDIWIAAIALQHDLTLVSRDDHFREIDGLKMQVW